MKLCQIVPSLEQRHGGPSKSAYELSAALARAGNQVNLLATALAEESSHSEGDLAVRQFHRDWPPQFCRSSGMARWMRQSEPEIVHHHSIWLRTLHYAHATARRTRAPLVVSPRGMMGAWAWRHHRWRKRFARYLLHPGALHGVSGWHATSEQEADEIRALGFSQPICVAPNGVNVPSAGEIAESAQHWRKTLGAGEQRPIALFYSRFHHKKRVLELIDLWLEQAPPNWLLLLAGIPEEYAPEMLDNYVRNGIGAGRVAVFSGAGRPPPYGAASLFLLPSHNENFGMAIAEALAHGVPALVTDTTPWAALNENGGGWCVPWAHYPAALRNALAEDPERLRQRGAGAREWVRREYSWDHPARILTEFYGRLRA